MSKNIDYRDIPEITVSFKNVMNVSDRAIVYDKEGIVKILRPVYDDFIEHHEEFWAVYLNNASRVLGVSQIAKGGISFQVIDIRILFQIALKASATAIVISHNHPSGNLQPSNDDIIITRQIKEACKIMEIRLLDHVILTKKSHLSIVDY